MFDLDSAISTCTTLQVYKIFFNKSTTSYTHTRLTDYSGEPVPER